MKNLINMIESSVYKDMPEFCRASWDDRASLVTHFDKFTASKKKAMFERMEFFTSSMESRDTVTPVMVALCPYGSFITLICLMAGHGDYFNAITFTGNDRITLKRAINPFGKNYPRPLDSIDHMFFQFNYHQMKSKPIEVSANIGDVFYSSWGYDQTNITYYEVTGVTKKTLTLVEIESESLEKDMAGSKTPLIGKHVGNEFKRKVKPDGSVSISTYENASALGFDMVAGVKIYHSKEFTSCA